MSISFSSAFPPCKVVARCLHFVIPGKLISYTINSTHSYCCAQTAHNDHQLIVIAACIVYIAHYRLCYHHKYIINFLQGHNVSFWLHFVLSGYWPCLTVSLRIIPPAALYIPAPEAFSGSSLCQVPPLSSFLSGHTSVRSADSCPLPYHDRTSGLPV